jgi:GntR family transcriptional regulator
VALYELIADDLRDKIKSGKLAAGSQLSPEPKLQEEYSERPEFSSSKVSRNTIRDAIAILVLEGLVEKRAGQGTFVVEKIDPFVTMISNDPVARESLAYQSEVTRRGRTSYETEPRVEIQFSSEAPELQLGDDQQVISRYQRRYIDRKPYSLQTSWYPRHYVQDGAERLDDAGEIEQGAVAYIEQTIGVKQGGWRERLRVRVANAEESAFFGLTAKPGAQVIEARRTAFNTDREPMRLTVTVYAADRNEFSYQAGEVPEEIPAQGSVSTSQR